MQQRVVITKKRNSAEATIAFQSSNYVYLYTDKFPNRVTYHGGCNYRIPYRQ